MNIKTHPLIANKESGSKLSRTILWAEYNKWYPYLVTLIAMEREALTICFPPDLLAKARKLKEGSESFNDLIVKALEREMQQRQGWASDRTKAENLFVGGGEIGALLRSHDWSQTPLGVIETWSDSLKTAVQILLTELDRVQQLESDLLERTSTDALPQAAQADAFRVKLTNALRLLTDANEIQAIAAFVLGEFLGANRVIYIEVLPSGKEVIVHKNYTNGVAELSGLYHLEDFGRNLTDDHRTGRTAIVPDVANYPKYSASDRARYRSIDIAAHIDVPLIKKDRFVALLAVHQANPRQWTEDEVKRVEETAEQTWAAVERARAEAALRDSRTELERQLRKFDALVAAIPDFIYTFDLAGRFTYVSPALLNLWQKTSDEALGKNFFELDYPTDLATRLQQQIQQAIATRQLLKDETPYTSAIGTRTYEYIFVPLLDINGAVEAVAGVTRDITERKQVEQALRQSEEQTRNILESIAEAFFALDENWQFTYINPSAEILLDRTPGDLVGKNLWEEYPGLIGNELAQVYLSTMRDAYGGRNHRLAGSITAFYPDHNRWYEVRTYPAPNGITVYFRNVTEQIQAERQVEFLTELSRRLGTVTDAVEINRIVTREVGTFLNGHRCYYLDVTPDGRQVTVLPDWRLDGSDLAGTYDLTLFGAKEWWETAASQPFGIDDVNTHPWTKDFADNYTLINLQSYVIAPFVREGRWVASIGVSSDKPRHWTADEMLLLENVAARVAPLIERARAEAALRDSEELKQRILESSKDCIKVLTLDSEIIYISTGGLCLLEVDDPTLVLNTCWQDIWQGEDYENAKTAIAAAKAGNTGHFQGYLPTYKGTPKWWDSIITPVRNTAGQVTQLVAISRDITKQKQAETERERLLAQEQAAREAADRANRIKDEFLAVLSHELRSPLNPILGWTQLLQNGKLSEARRAEALKIIERNANLQTQLIEDLLDISRIMQGKLNLTAAPVSLTFVISAAVETVRLAAEAKNIAIALDLDSEIALISGDVARLQQVMWNLLTNAVKFTPNSGQVTIKLRQLDGLAQIRVIDTGKGINPQFLPHVFEYFRQEDGSTTRKFGGLGLGLAIVRQIVEMHGGTVTAESPGENQGATFIIQLPLMQQARAKLNASEPIHTQTEAEVPLDGVQILLVDDEPDTREFQAFVLSQSGANVTAVASGLEALQALEQFSFDVLVSDIGMPEMDGYMLMQQIRSRPPNQGGNIRAIALTAYAAEIDRQRALQVGFQTHITKPVEPEKLVRAVVSLVS
ncbi:MULTISPECIES: YlcI/YnfO family protein [unclassified Nostoc]|uniref:YlcI/YnfO family protein n=1 Tax=unclassified Nostoc TaxID=2593658 RepID=UPI002AD50D60|nr:MULTISPECIES: YlcI/YnfO family protein [unclassified Nostoc]MDZ8096952.1 YlcI/YnfO family protein [Nostoc sp. DedQUE05]MDZ8129865.1 YlcI/YnfO family protein [Nostoc sp. DedQUE07]